MILDKIVAATEKRVCDAKANLPLSELQQQVERMPITKDFPFEQALQELDFNFICEVKKASPSKGIIAEEFPYLEIANDYEMAGAAAISVLTEPDFFLGSPQYLQEIAEAVHIPVLRKDFIIDEYQIYEAKLWGASAILLIVAILDDDTMRRFHELADSLGLSCLVEAHDETEVLRAVSIGARIIGVNNRNLKDFTVDVNNSIRLRNLVDDSVIFVSESGLDTAADIQCLRDNDIHAALMGESFMRSANKVEKLAELYGPIRHNSFMENDLDLDVLGKKRACKVEGLPISEVTDRIVLEADSVTEQRYEVKVKFCGITQLDTVPVLLETGPDYVGFVFAPSKRQVTVEQAQFIARDLRDGLKTTSGAKCISCVGVFVNETIPTIVEIAKAVPLSVVQLHGDETIAYIETLRNQLQEQQLESVEIWKAIQVQGKEDMLPWEQAPIDGLVVDAYSKEERGGTGKTIDWSLLEGVQIPYYLAGGIGLHNVARAIRRLRPYGLDMSSSLETNGQKDAKKMSTMSQLIKQVTNR
ncbi:indole-3-glycerol phosphate synthase TrpC [Veillonella sp. CHU740]|uniref:indole-3-glycerol phosphate synthase TrpC n=1 Tax=Veillonella sp. CHU740 TaxID=2490950 RepID=UPI000F8D1C04|nr:indole-3-glycerol phosphate synthase TrpC [Veillonella sp. CHU740]